MYTSKDTKNKKQQVTSMQTMKRRQTQTCVPSMQDTIKCSNSTLPVAIFGN